MTTPQAPCLTWADPQDGLVHELSHVNDERRAARTACGRYVEFWPGDVHDDRPATCLTCVGAADLLVYDALQAQTDVGERWQDIVRRCREHLTRRDLVGRCRDCGYDQVYYEGANPWLTKG